jgi:hypothetical protein
MDSAKNGQPEFVGLLKMCAWSTGSLHGRLEFLMLADLGLAQYHQLQV